MRSQLFCLLMLQSLEHKSSCQTDLLLISGIVRACCPCVIGRRCVFQPVSGTPPLFPAVYLYNGCLFKPWYLSGQVEVCCLMSSMWPQSGMRSADRRLCPVSDWGLGLVTGPPVLSVGWFPLSLSVPPQPSHAPLSTSRPWRGRVLAGDAAETRDRGTARVPG